jgi:hypothetical protein
MRWLRQGEMLCSSAVAISYLSVEPAVSLTLAVDSDDHYVFVEFRYAFGKHVI